MKAKRILFLYRINLAMIQQVLLFIAEMLILLASLSAIFVLVYQFGFEQTAWQLKQFNTSHLYILLSFFIGITIRNVVKFKDIIEERMFYVDVSIYFMLFAVLLCQLFFKTAIEQSLPFLSFLQNTWIDYMLMLLLSIIHLSRLTFSLMQSRIRPTLLFSYSFLFVILVGTGLLMLPNATHHGIAFIDALFISTTSVCVTGLTSIDPANTFTPTGYIIIMLLIQIGGLGVMTFTSFFALSFMNKSSFNSQFMLKDVLNEDRISGLFRVLISIIFVTALIESAGAYLIYMEIKDTFPGGTSHEIFYSVFHSISAFCNAGISTMSGNLGDPLVVHNYALHFWIAILIVLGGLGFPIVFNYMKLMHHLLSNAFFILIGKQKYYIHRPHIINVHTYIVVLSTLVLLLFGTIIFYLAENNNVLAGLPLSGKLTGAFFGAVTPRTAGFSIADMSSLSSTTLLLMLLLMAIGASPMSTGGGIKTTTVFVVLVTMWNSLRYKSTLDVFGRAIMPQNVRRAIAIILLYIIWTFIATILLSYSEKEAPPFTLIFEVVSALSTVGLSLNFTPHLTTFGKVIIILTMFIGRIGVLTFFSGFLKVTQRRNYSYPQENILM